MCANSNVDIGILDLYAPLNLLLADVGSVPSSGWPMLTVLKVRLISREPK